MNVMKFRTPHKIVPRKHVSLSHRYLIGLDLGFSSIKGFAHNKYFCIPAHVKKIKVLPVIPKESDIIYRDESGFYMVGRTAQELINAGDTSDTEAEMYGRNRYFSKNFEIMAMVGIACGISENKYGGRNPDAPIIIQTGLPPAYLKEDRRKITKVLSNPHSFSMKIGTEEWMDYTITVDPEHVFVMDQPAGTLYSILINKDGIYLPDARNTLMKNILVADAGFRTFDPYGLINRQLVVHESLPNLGMQRILKEASHLIFEDYGEDIRVPAMQKILGKGVFEVFREEEMKSEEIPVAPYIEKANKLVCMESVEVLKSTCNYLRDYEIFIPTGGTCSTWIGMYKESFKGLKGLTFLPSNMNDAIPMLYSNVRGYYMYRYMTSKEGD